MKVFITGASGYIGEEVALAFRRAGHDVFGLVRNPDSPISRNLAVNEIHLVAGDLTKPETYEQIASTADVLIHTAADYTQYDNVDITAVKTLFSAGSKRGKKVTFIYTSGILVYPDSNQVQNEDDPTDPSPVPILRTRIQQEKDVTSSTLVHGVVIRPGFVWGGRLTHPNANYVKHFHQAESGNVTVENPHTIHSQTHIHDLADAYVKIGEASPSVVGGHTFNIVDDSRNTNLAVATKFAQVAGYKGEVKEAESPSFFSAFQKKTVIVDYRKATRLVGWIPKQRNLLDDVESFYKAWKASQKL